MTDTPKSPTLPYTFHATLAEYRRRLGAWRIVLALALTFLIYLRFGFVTWLLSVVAIVVIIVGILWFLGRRSVTITPEGVDYKNGLGTHFVIPFAEMDGAKVFVNYYEASFGVVPRVTIGRKAGTAPISLMGLYWRPEELDKLIAVLNDKKVKVEYFEDIATYTMIAKQFPAYATYVERHPYKLATFIVIGILVLITAIVIPLTLN